MRTILVFTIIALSLSAAQALEDCSKGSNAKKIACLSRNVDVLDRLLKNFVLVNTEATAGKKCLYKAGVNTSDNVALEKCDSVLPNNEYMTWRVEQPKLK